MAASLQKSFAHDLLSENGNYAAIGCHPSRAPAFRVSGVEIARRFMSHPKVVAVGEIGES